jgi:microcystin-dependent protein
VVLQADIEPALSPPAQEDAIMEVFMGTIQAFGFNFAPVNWALAQGQIMAITQNTALFSLLGTNYGGNGVSTFGLPDLQGRLAIGQGNGQGLSPYVIGERSGTENTTLLSSNLPPHTHSLNGSQATATNASPSGLMLSAATGADQDGNPVTVLVYGPAGTSAPMSPTSIGLTGSSIPFSILQPFLAINYSICLYGIFPSRN